MSDDLTLKSWSDLAYVEGDGVNRAMLAKASAEIVQDLAAVLAFERLQSVGIPGREADLEQRRRALSENEAEAERRADVLREVQAQLADQERELEKLVADRHRSEAAADAAWRAERAIEQARKAAAIVANQLHALRLSNDREREKLRNLPVTLDALRAIERPATPALDTVLAALSLR